MLPGIGSSSLIFRSNIPLAALVLIISFWHVSESRSSDPGSVNWLGASMATFGLAGLVYGFLESAILGWMHPGVIGTLVFGMGSLTLFIFVEKRTKIPMVPLKLFQSASFSGANLLTLFLYAALGIFFFLFPLNLIQIQKYSATATGAAALPMILLMFLLSRWSGGLIARYGPKMPLIVGPLIAAMASLLFAVPDVGSPLLDRLLSSFRCSGAWHGHLCRSFDNCGHELRRAGTGWDSVGD